MVILHIAAIQDTKFSGVGVVVPKHVLCQQASNTVGFINIFNIEIEDIQNQLTYRRGMKIQELPSPFNKPEIVIFHELYYIDFLYLYKDVYKNNIPFIIVPHGGLTKQAQSIKKLKKKVANILLFIYFFNKATAFHFLSEAERNESLDVADSFIIPNGMTLKSNTLKTIENTTFTYIGRISIFHKGLDLLIEGVCKIKDYLENNDVTINIYGPENEDSIVLKKMISRYGLENIISINGPVTDQNKLNILLGTTYFIQTSRFEGVPMGILEALSYGIPCCVTEGTNLSQYIEMYNAGFTSDCDSNSISKMIIKAVNNKSMLQDMHANSKQLILDNFSWDMISKKYMDTYTEIIDKQRRR